MANDFLENDNALGKLIHTITYLSKIIITEETKTESDLDTFVFISNARSN